MEGSYFNIYDEINQVNQLRTCDIARRDRWNVVTDGCGHIEAVSVPDVI